jgi:hypothetical protein
MAACRAIGVTVMTGSVFQRGTGRLAWAELLAAASEFAGWADTEQVFVYDESVDDCRIQSRQAVSTIAPPPRAFEGRFFNSQADVRWVAGDDGRFEAWVVREAKAGDDPDAVVDYAEVKPRHYYLLGIAIGEPGRFEEARYPGKVFKYPVERPARKQRASVKVLEYFRAAPGWKSIAGEERTELALNEPMLCAHRFVDVDAGDND